MQLHRRNWTPISIDNFVCDIVHNVSCKCKAKSGFYSDFCVQELCTFTSVGAHPFIQFYIEYSSVFWFSSLECSVYSVSANIILNEKYFSGLQQNWSEAQCQTSLKLPSSSFNSSADTVHNSFWLCNSVFMGGGAHSLKLWKKKNNSGGLSFVGRTSCALLLHAAQTKLKGNDCNCRVLLMPCFFST